MAPAIAPAAAATAGGGGGLAAFRRRPPPLPLTKGSRTTAGGRTQLHTRARALRQRACSWGLERDDDDGNGGGGCIADAPRPRLLVVDGTNVAAISAGAGGATRRGGGSGSNAAGTAAAALLLAQQHGTTHEARFAAWLAFLRAFVGADAALVAFDTKGGAGLDVRSQLDAGYLRPRLRRRSPADGGGGGGAGWSHLRAPAERAGFLVTEAALGFEADDVLAAAADWACGRSSGDGAAGVGIAVDVVVASADSDAQALLRDGSDGSSSIGSSSTCSWLELLEASTAAHPSGLALRTAAAFRAERGFRALAWPLFQSLTNGKAGSGVRGAGLTSKQARALCADGFTSMEQLLAAADSGELRRRHAAAHQALFGGGGDGKAAAAAARAWAVLRPRPEAQRLPEGDLRAALLLRAASGGGAGEAMLPALPPPPRELALLHPALAAHAAAVAPYVAALGACLRALSVRGEAAAFALRGGGQLLGDSGLWADALLLRLDVGGGSSSRDDDDEQQQQPEPRRWLAVQVLSPRDLRKCIAAAADDAAGSSSSSNRHPAPRSYAEAVDALAAQLQAEQQRRPGGRLEPRQLLARAGGAAQRRFKLAARAGWRVAIVPFFELHDDGSGSSGSSGGSGGSGGEPLSERALEFVREELRRQQEAATTAAAATAAG